MEKHVSSFSTLFFLVLFLLSFPVQALSGNLTLIEKRLKELDQLNKEAVTASGQLPENGSVEIKATVLPGGIKARKALPGVKTTRFNFGKKVILNLEQKQPYTVQISSSQVKSQCYRVASMLRRAGYPAFTSEVDFKDKGIWHRIFIGSFATRAEAEVIKNSLEEDEISDGFIRELPYAVQIDSAFSNMEDIRQIKTKVTSLNYLPYTSYILDKNKNRKIRLLLGAFKTRADAASLLAGLRRNGLQARVVNR